MSNSKRSHTREVIPYRKRLKYLARYKIGSKRREVTGYSIDPDVLQEFREATPHGTSRSAIVEGLIILWLKNPGMLKESAA